jgi:hypothetical protein
MFLFKLIKGFIKLVFSLVVGLVLIIWLVRAFISYKQSGELPYQDVTYMMSSYVKNDEVPRGTWCQCPVCDKYYYKDDSPCCSHKCEREYREMVKAWNSVNNNRQFIENHGKKFK